MRAKCSYCKHLVRINEHHVILTHNAWHHITIDGKDFKARKVCDGSYRKALLPEPNTKY